MDLEYSFDEDGSAGHSPPRTKSRKGSAGQPSKTFSCNICGLHFSRQAILNEHFRAEHLQERVKCTICGKPFKRQNDRRRHETFQHLRKRAFQCMNGGFGCGKRFTRMDSLREHQANPKKAGTTCEQAMLFAKAQPPSVQPSLPPPLPLPLPQQCTASEPESFIPIMARMDAGGVVEIAPPPPPPPPPQAPHELDVSLSPTSTDSEGLAAAVAAAAATREPRSWLDWQMDLAQKRVPDPSMMVSNISYPTIPESRLRHTAAGLAVCLSPFQCLVAQQDHWAFPDPSMFDEISMWGSMNWPKAYECRTDDQ